MPLTDRSIREAFVETCRQHGVSTHALNIEVHGVSLTINGMVVSDEQRHNLWSLLEAVDTSVTDIVCRVGVVPVPPMAKEIPAGAMVGERSELGAADVTAPSPLGALQRGIRSHLIEEGLRCRPRGSSSKPNTRSKGVA